MEPPGDPRRMFALTEAINSYGGPLLPEFSSDWVLERRRTLELRYLDLLAQNAQEAMMRTQRVRDNPHWLEAPRLLSPPGSGGHPRGMAIDIGLETLDGTLVDMGCAFDYLAENQDSSVNPAHRDYAHSTEILENRAILDNCMIRAVNALELSLFLLPQEWWDFRFRPDTYGMYIPLSDDNLPDHMRLL